METNESPKEVALRECEEETGFNSFKSLIDACIFRDEDFVYYNFIGLVDEEFDVHLDWETEDVLWVTYDELMKITPKHH